MFIELTEDAYYKFKNVLIEKGFQFESSDCTLPGDSCKHIHVELGQIGKVEAEILSKDVDKIYGLIAEESNVEKEEDLVYG